MRYGERRRATLAMYASLHAYDGRGCARCVTLQTGWYIDPGRIFTK